jgi:hypothetical protein
MHPFQEGFIQHPELTQGRGLSFQETKMLFDRLCGIVERLFTDNTIIMKLLKDAKIFTFDHDYEFFSRRDYDHEFQCVHFFLPFRTVAVEDPMGMTLLHDPEPKMQGIELLRTFLNFFHPFTRDERLKPSYYNQSYVRTIKNVYNVDYEELYTLQLGQFARRYVQGSEVDYQLVGRLHQNVVCTKNRIIQDNRYDVGATDGDYMARLEQAFHDVDVTFEQIIRLNMPDRFVVEISPTKQKQRQTEIKFIRSIERPQYVLKTPTEIRKMFGLGQSQSPPPPRPQIPGHRFPLEPHPRRRHYRTLKSDFWKNKKGETIVVEATWVGPSEVVRGNKKYRVLLDI